MLCAVLILGAGISAARISCGDTQSTDKHGALTLSIRYPGQNAERIERMIVMPHRRSIVARRRRRAYHLAFKRQRSKILHHGL